MENRSLVTIAEHSREKILYMLEMAKEFEAHPNRHILDGKVMKKMLQYLKLGCNNIFTY